MELLGQPFGLPWQIGDRRLTGFDHAILGMVQGIGKSKSCIDLVNNDLGRLGRQGRCEWRAHTSLPSVSLAGVAPCLAARCMDSVLAGVHELGRVTSGIAQGRPLSGALFVSAMGPIGRRICSTFMADRAGMLRQCVDDIAVLLRGIRFVTSLAPVFRNAGRFAGMRLKPEKREVVMEGRVLGPAERSEIGTLRRRRSRVGDLGKYLGIFLSRGEDQRSWRAPLEGLRRRSSSGGESSRQPSRPCAPRRVDAPIVGGAGASHCRAGVAGAGVGIATCGARSRSGLSRLGLCRGRYRSRGQDPTAQSGSLGSGFSACRS